MKDTLLVQRLLGPFAVTWCLLSCVEDSASGHMVFALMQFVAFGAYLTYWAWDFEYERPA